MGVSQAEFTSYPTWAAETASGTTPKPGRVHIYTSTQAAEFGAIGPGSTLAPQEDETVLMGTGATAGAANGTYMMYDQILLPCWGDAFTKSAAELGNLISYGNSGGRFFATHYSYSWLQGNGVLNGTAQWDPKADQNDTNPIPTGQPFTGSVSAGVPTSNPGLFVKWLNLVGALDGSNPGGAVPANPTVTIQSGRHDVDKVLGASSEWIDGVDPAPAAGDPSQMLLHFTFDMPIGQSGQCGHAIYSDFHVNGTQSNGTTFPSECDTNALTPQERILEYMIWDLASCVPSSPPSSCVPKTCQAQGISCGPAGDTCGNLIAGGCGSCPTGQTCGGAGTPGVCGPPTSSTSPPPGNGCTPMSCQQQNITCGPAADGCGNENRRRLRRLPAAYGVRRRRRGRPVRLSDRLRAAHVRAAERELRRDRRRLRRRHGELRHLRAARDVRRRRHARPVRHDHDPLSKPALGKARGYRLQTTGYSPREGL